MKKLILLKSRQIGMSYYSINNTFKFPYYPFLKQLRKDKIKKLLSIFDN